MYSSLFVVKRERVPSEIAITFATFSVLACSRGNSSSYSECTIADSEFGIYVATTPLSLHVQILLNSPIIPRT